MSFSEKSVALLNSLLENADAALVRKSALDTIQTRAALFSRMFGDETSLFVRPSYNPGCLPEGAEDYLRASNPRLLELKEKYESLTHPAADRSFWSEELIDAEVNLRYFRGDNAYLWQRRDLNTSINYFLATYYLRGIDTFGLLDKLKEDGLFGACVYNFNDRLLVSRDLLDSMHDLLVGSDCLFVTGNLRFRDRDAQRQDLLRAHDLRVRARPAGEIVAGR